MRIFWALGYFQAEYYIGKLRPEQLTMHDRGEICAGIRKDQADEAERHCARAGEGGTEP